MRLIDADELSFDRLTDSICQGQAEDVVAEAPTIEAEPVRRGKWLLENIGKPNEHCVCSECGTQVDSDEAWHYCPNCGAKMEGGEE